MSWGVESPIEHRWDLFEKCPTMVESRFNEMKAFGNTGFNMAYDAISRLEDIVAGLHLINRIIGIDTTTINTNALPTRDEPVFDASLYNFRGSIDPPPDPTGLLSNFLNDSDFPSDSERPTLVGPGSIDEGPLIYTSALLTKLQSKILNDLTTGSTGIEPWIEDAMFQRNHERDLVAFNDEMDQIAANWSSGGCPYPNGGLRAAQDRATREFGNKRQDVSRDIMIKSWELALQNSHFIIQQGIAIEALLIKWAESAATRIFEASKAVIDANIRVFDIKMKEYSERIKWAIDKAMAKIQYNIGIIRQYEAAVNAYAARMKAEGDRINAVARGDEAEVNVFTALLNKDIKKIEIDLKVIQAKIEQAVNNAHILIKDKEVDLTSYRELNALKAKAQEAVGSIAAQVAAGALAAVHAQVSIGSTDGASYYFNPNDVPAED